MNSNNSLGLRTTGVEVSVIFPFMYALLLRYIFQLFRPINVRVALIMVETWNQRDRIEVVEDSNKCLDNFMVYRNGDLWRKQKHDNAMLIT